MISFETLKLIFFVHRLGSVMQIFPFDVVQIQEPGKSIGHIFQWKVELKSGKLWKINTLIMALGTMIFLLSRTYILSLDGVTTFHVIFVILSTSVLLYPLGIQIFYIYRSQEMMLLIQEFLNLNGFGEYFKV